MKNNLSDFFDKIQPIILIEIVSVFYMHMIYDFSIHCANLIEPHISLASPNSWSPWFTVIACVANGLICVPVGIYLCHQIYNKSIEWHLLLVSYSFFIVAYITFSYNFLNMYILNLLLYVNFIAFSSAKIAQRLFRKKFKNKAMQKKCCACTVKFKEMT